MNRVDLLSTETAVRLINAAQAYLRDRKLSSQPIGTHNVKYTLTSAGDPAWSGTLPSSPQAPSIGLRVLRLTVSTKNQADLFCRIIPRLDVGADGNWYRPSAYLAALKAGQTGYLVNVIPDIEFGMTRNAKSWLVTIQGALSTQVFLRLWVAANDEVTTSVQVVSI